MKSKKLLTLSVLLFTNISYASDMSCQMSENVTDKEISSEFNFKIDETGNGKYQFSRSEGGLTSGYLLSKNKMAVWTMLDPVTHKPFSATFSSAEGTSNRVQLVPNEKNNDYIFLDCNHSDMMAPSTKPKSLNCELIERAGSQSFSTQFEAPIATSGHDIFQIPESKLIPLAGWVLAYNGVLVNFLQNKNTNTGITVMGSWDAKVSLSWFPTSQNIQATLSCVPVL